MFSDKITVLRMRKGVAGVGRKLARHFNANEVTCNFRPKVRIPDNSFVLNYGRSAWPIWYLDARERGVVILNTPTAVGNSVDKRLTLELLSTRGVPTLDWSTDRTVAEEWAAEGHAVVVRHQVKGKKGNGIELVSGTADVPDAPLYTKHYEKTHEFRVHIVNGEVIDYVQKKRMGKKKRDALGLTDNDMLVRNHKRGWVFAHNDIIVSDIVKRIALDATKALGLDFAGIDVLAKVEDGNVVDAVVCESNSAPGMSSTTTFNAYAQAFAKLIGE